MLNERTQKLPQDEQNALVSLWKALGLSYQGYTESPSDKKQTDDACDGSKSLDYVVLVRHQSENQSDPRCLTDHGRRHLRHSVDGECEYRKMGMSGYGEAVLQNISASGLGIGIYRKLHLNSSITVLVDTDNRTHLPLLIHATVVRDAGMSDDSLYCYGCEIERVIDPNL